MFNQLLLICCVVGLGSAWTQPSTCYVRPSGSSTDSEYLRDIRDYMASISTSLQQLVAQGQDCPEPTTATTDPPTTATTDPPTTATTDPPSPPIGSIENPASSCSEIPHDQPSGYYYIGDASSPIEVYCDMDRTSCSCNSTGGWTRVADLDMRDPSQTCPSGFRLITTPVRTCGRDGPAANGGCASTTYPVYGVEYSHVCGRVVAYQFGRPEAFVPYDIHQTRTIDDVYAEGVVLTHGQSPRQHIWTFAVAHDETSSDRFRCPCTRPDTTFTGTIPPFIGEDYFCDTGSRTGAELIFYQDDPLWDGAGCGGTSTCCEFNNPPWFCKQLPQPTTDDIELRLCADIGINDEDVPIEVVEIYIR